jgi:hypothetical protein
MTEFPVKYRLYDSTGTSLIYTFTYVQSDNSPQDPKDFVEIDGLRGVGSIIIPGSTEAWDLELRFIIKGTDYSDLMSQMDSLETTIVMQTKYILKIDRTSSTTKNYNVMRLSPIQFIDLDFRTRFQECLIKFRVNCWS